MRILSNEDIDGLLTMPECIAVLEEMYRDYASGEALLVPRIDNFSPSTEPGAYYGFKQMGGAWPRRRVQALRINSDIITHPVIAGKPVLHPAWLRPGVHVSCIKSQEVDQALLDGCDRVVIHVAAQPKRYDNVMPGTPNPMPGDETSWWKAPGNRFAEYPELAQLVTRKSAGRTSRSDITCFVNNVGIGLQFAAAGALVLDKARVEGVGHELPDDWFSETVHP